MNTHLTNGNGGDEELEMLAVKRTFWYPPVPTVPTLNNFANPSILNDAMGNWGKGMENWALGYQKYCMRIAELLSIPSEPIFRVDSTGFALDLILPQTQNYDRAVDDATSRAEALWDGQIKDQDEGSVVDTPIPKKKGPGSQGRSSSGKAARIAEKPAVEIVHIAEAGASDEVTTSLSARGRARGRGGTTLGGRVTRPRASPKPITKKKPRVKKDHSQLKSLRVKAAARKQGSKPQLEEIDITAMTGGDLCDEDPLQNEYQQEYDDSRVAQKLTGGYPTTPKIDNDSELTYANTPAADESQAIVDCDMELERDMEEMFTNQTLDAQDHVTVGDVEDGYFPLPNTQEVNVNDLDLGRFMEGNLGKPVSGPQNQDTISIVTSGLSPVPPSPTPEDQGVVNAIRDRVKHVSSIGALFGEDNDSKLHSQVGDDTSDGEMDFETEFAAGFIRDKDQWRGLRRLFIEGSDEPAPGSIESLFSMC